MQAYKWAGAEWKKVLCACRDREGGRPPSFQIRRWTEEKIRPPMPWKSICRPSKQIKIEIPFRRRKELELFSSWEDWQGSRYNSLLLSSSPFMQFLSSFLSSFNSFAWCCIILKSVPFLSRPGRLSTTTLTRRSIRLKVQPKGWTWNSNFSPSGTAPCFCALMGIKGSRWNLYKKKTGFFEFSLPNPSPLFSFDLKTLHPYPFPPHLFIFHLSHPPLQKAISLLLLPPLSSPLLLLPLILLLNTRQEVTFDISNPGPISQIQWKLNFLLSITVTPILFKIQSPALTLHKSITLLTLSILRDQPLYLKNCSILSLVKLL